MRPSSEPDFILAMKFTSVLRILGVLLIIFSTTMLPPIGVSLFYNDGEAFSFLEGFMVTLSTGIVIWLPFRKRVEELKLRDGFMVVVLFWVVLGLSGSMPLLMSDALPMSFTDAAFESISGLTTTGATVISGLDELPKSLLYYRQQLQWLGGMGIIVLAVAVLPMLGIGGMQLYKAETPGPMKDSKLTPRITETAKALWYIYLFLTIACAISYMAAGMTMFDAIGHSFATVAIGGFSTHDESMGFFKSHAVEWVAIVFLLLSGINFALHFTAWRYKNLLIYFRDSEFKFYLTIMVATSLVVSGYLYFHGEFVSLTTALHKGFFQTVSIGTTAGFTTSDYSQWPGFVAILLLFLSFIGGCAGSTGGGIKVIRFLLLIKQGSREINRLIHPRAHIPIRIGSKVIDNRVFGAVWGFFALYVASFIFMYLALAFTGIELMTAFSSVAACMNNLGPGLGSVGTSYAHLNDAAKWILCFAMLLGRLEIFTLLVLLTPAYWRK